jgi:hypothetical protein
VPLGYGYEPDVDALLRELAAANERYEVLQRAHATLGQRLLAERLRFAEMLAALDQSDLDRVEAAFRIAELENQLEIAEAEAAEARGKQHE